jgi:hypothetical protein
MNYSETTASSRSRPPVESDMTTPSIEQRRSITLNAIRVVAAVLIIGGILALLYGGFTYTRATHDVALGPIEFSVQEKERVNIPLWAGIGLITAGGVLLFVPRKR